MKKKVFAFILAFALVISLSACGGKTETTGAEDSSASTTAAEAEKDKDVAEKTNADSSETDAGNGDIPSAAGQSDKDNSGSSANSYQPNAGNASVNNPNTNTPGGSSGNSGNSSSNKPAHQHNYNTVVSSTNGDCSHKGTVTKKCSCGATITVEGNYGSHNWKDSFKEIHHEAVTKPVYAYCYVCNKCGAQFKDEQSCGEHCIFDCGGSYSYKEWIDHYDTVTPAWTERVPNGKDCTICGKHSN